MPKHLLKLLIISALLALTVAGYLLWPNEYEGRQVKAIPPANLDSAAKLDMSRHVRHSERPAEVFDFPIPINASGPSVPLYSGGMQYPFYCMSLESELGQPLVDNQQGWGVPVYDQIENIGKSQHIIGYSKDCALATRVRYVAELPEGEFVIFDSRPPEGYRHLFRLEQGSINRFIYALIMPVSVDEIGLRDSSELWNKRLIYQFAGGSGIGFRQGRMSMLKILSRRLEQLHQGYAVITSTGNRSSYTYNMLLAEDTARRVKTHFISLYGEPDYTLGIGGSGGGLAQYLIGQNSRGIIDGAIAQYSYPDMVSQTLYALDCDLLNAYYSFKSDRPEFWQDWSKRQQLEGLNALNGERHYSAFLEPLNQILAGRWPVLPRGNSECINGWFGLTSFIHNPAQGFIREFFADTVVNHTKWNYWEDMVNLFGRDNLGFANSTWGNVGVQYGLAALRQGSISAQQFIHLNWHIGGWKDMEQMRPELLWAPNGKQGALWLTLWSKHNITQPGPLKNRSDLALAVGGQDNIASPQGTPAPRQRASKQAIEAAYRSGQVFIGNIDIPILDIRHYLEHKLDMHHVSASFSARIRIQQAMGHYKNQVIWVADEHYNPVSAAFDAMHQWMLAIKANPDKAAWQSIPATLQDSCFNAQGEVMHSGEGVWDGAWNHKPQGACSRKFSIFSNSRIQAGGPWQGSIFQCHLIPVEQAMSQGVYGAQDMRPYLTQLQKIFPTGVCDYRRGDSARPTEL